MSLRLFVILSLSIVVSKSSEDVNLSRVKRQVQSLITVLQQNPALVQQLQQNPALLQTLQNQLAQQQQQQQLQQQLQQQQLQQQQQQFLSPLSLVGNIPLLSTADNECATLRKQNKLFRQMLLSVAGEDHGALGASLASSNPRELLLAATTNPAQDLLERVVGGGAPPRVKNDELLTSILVTPTPTWSTEESSTTFITTVTETASTEVPIILRGKKIITTILNEETKVVTATETKTSSSLITPSPSWSTFVITQTPSVDLLAETFANLETETKPFHEENRPKKRNNNVVQAQVIEIDETTTPRASKLDRFREAYGSYFASSAQRSAQRFGDSFKRIPSSGGDGEEDIFDQQVQPANNRPVYVPSPAQPSHKEFTLYFSGKNPGEVSSRITALPVDHAGRPIRSKREVIDPSKVKPIEHTAPPSNLVELEVPLDGALSHELENLESSMEPCVQGSEVTTVTVTQYLTITKL